MAGNVNTAFAHTGDLESSSCKCENRCCPFKGCCCKTPGRSLESLPYTEDYAPVTIQTTAPQKQQVGRRSFLDLPREIRNKVYVQVVLSDTAIGMKLNPTIMDHGEEHQWGRDNAWAILAVCRRLYHEASSLAYKENYFQVYRGTHRDFSITKHPGMPFEHIRFLHIVYPLSASPCNWNMNHMWSHWLDDVETVRKRFPHLKRVFLMMGYDGYHSNTSLNYRTWAPLFFKRPGDSVISTLQRMTAVVRALKQLHGRKMPSCVQLNICGYVSNPITGEIRPADHMPSLLDLAIPMAADPNVDLRVYRRESFPLYWVTGDEAYFLGDEDYPAEYEQYYEAQVSDSEDGE